ncbi:VWA domain-containing protein [Thalassoglobus polymorphus]|uniref:von Willebrand factor type A domain protein n=1 Tax=Thalassoglobus polymorphus TaxID=2527994 RepID=A0A517QHW2_9PLAN|nr:VWA domain-containing protein [Thalassoglobus polymorphus]QDT31208.1 von Willebrand factor type A domain protein [Thalassoglobus polymorphus]
MKSPQWWLRAHPLRAVVHRARFLRTASRKEDDPPPRRGAFIVLTAFCLVACFAFVSLAIDIGYLVLTKTQLQNAVDSAAIAAAQEITEAIKTAPEDVENITLYAEEAAREVARQIAELNETYINKEVDVIFGARMLNEETGQYEVNWGVHPSNVVKVVARRNNEDSTAPDGKLALFFAGVTGDKYAKLQAEAIAYVEARDIVVVHDFSRSMNFDSYFNDEAAAHLSKSQIESNLGLVWSDLGISLGNMAFSPQYLSLGRTSNGTTTGVTFKYDDCTVTTSSTLRKVKIRYTDGGERTFNDLSGQTANLDGSKDIATVWITSEGPPGDFVVSNSGIDVTFPNDRLSATTNSPDPIRELYVGFTDDTDDYISFGNGGPLTYEYTSTKTIDYVYVEVLDGRSFWYYFDAPDGENPNVVERYDDTNAAVKEAFGLTGSYPYPGGSWDSFINHCRNGSELAANGYREMYGGLTWTDYTLRHQSGHWETPDLWKTRHYPFHAIKEGHFLFCNFLDKLGFGDQLGMVSYDTNHRREDYLNDPDPEIPIVDIRHDPITHNYPALKDLMAYRQAAHYSYATNMGGGLKDAISLLDDAKRDGARPTILLMTDGNTNTIDSGEDTSLPSGWNWDEMLDYDGDGNADYSTSSSQKRYVLRLAYQAVESDYTIHTMAVGIDADRDLMRAIAHIGKGHFIDIPGGVSVNDMTADVEAAFHKIASFVPSAKLMYVEE